MKKQTVGFSQREFLHRMLLKSTLCTQTSPSWPAAAECRHPLYSFSSLSRNMKSLWHWKRQRGQGCGNKNPLKNKKQGSCWVALMNETYWTDNRTQNEFLSPHALQYISINAEKMVPDCARGQRVPPCLSINYFLVAGGGQHVRLCSAGCVHHSIWQRYVSNAAV